MGGFVVPAVLGNAIGGVLLVALLNHGQVVAEKEQESESQSEGTRPDLGSSREVTERGGDR